MLHRFDEIAVNSTTKKKPVEADKDTYLGLEHLDSGNLTVTRFGSEVAPIGEKLLMKKGDVLFGKRRAYQKKVAIAPFDGIFSAHGMVLRPREDIVDKNFFPLFIASDYFLDAAIKISVGSLSPTINWGALKELWFDLPNLDEQRRLAEILWAMIEAKNAYTKLLAKIDDLVKSQFVEMFGGGKYKEVPIAEVLETPMSGEWGNEDTDKTGIPVLKTTNFTDTGEIFYGEVVTRQIDEKKAQKKWLRNGDILIEKSGGSDTKPVGRVVYYDGVDDVYLFNNFTALLRPRENFIGRYVFGGLFNGYWSGSTRLYENKTTGIHNLKLAEYLENTTIPNAPIEAQHRFAEFAEQADKSKFELRRTLDELDAAYKALVRERLGVN